MDVMLPNDDEFQSAAQETFCVYTNSDYNNGRGISMVVTPEVAASVTSETFGMGIGGLEGMVGEEMGMWEVKSAPEKGKGLFARKDIGSIFAGESIIIQTPVLLVSKILLGTIDSAGNDSVLDKAISQLPESSRQAVQQLDTTHGSATKSIVLTNGMPVKWPWVDDTPELLAVVPEAAVSSLGYTYYSSLAR